MRYALSSEFRMKLKKILPSLGARETAQALAIILVGSFHRNLPHFFFEHGHKSCGRRREGGKTKETEGERRGERMEKKEEGEGEGGGVKEERGGKKLGKTLKKLASTSPESNFSPLNL